MAKRSFIGGAVILMGAGLAVRVLGFIYRIFLSNLIGAEGMGLFQLISPVYGLIVMTLTSGISIAVSKMVAEEAARKNYKNVGRTIYVAFFTVSAAGLGISILMLVYADFIAATILKDARTYLSIMVLIPCIPAVAAAAALKGYYYGVQNMGPTAVSAICEQLAKMAIVMTFIGSFLNKGVEYACAMAIFGSAVGEIVNMLVLVVYYKLRRNIFPREEFARSRITRKRVILKDLLTVSVPVSFNRLIISTMSAVEMILIPRMLLAGGLDYTFAMEEYGKLAGMAMPLIYFPSLITNALATSLVPAVSEAVSLRNFKTANYRISKSIQFTFMVGFIFTAVFLTYPHEIGNLIYRKVQIGNMLSMLALACVFTYLTQTLLGILNGLGKQGIALQSSIIGSAVRIAFVFFLVPVHGIPGYIAGMIISSAVVNIINIAAIVKATGMLIDLRLWVLKPAFTALIMYFAGRYFYVFYDLCRIPHSLNVILAVGTEVIVALVLMLLLGVLDRRDVRKLLPHGIRR